jgi:hypothetical protein
MDPVSLATGAVAALTPYLVKSGEAVAGELGKKALTAGESILKALWSRWRDKPQSQERLTNFVKNPDAGREGLTMALVAEVATDKTFAEALDRLLKGDPPELFISQVFKDATEVTGAEVQEMIRGHLTVTQEIDKAAKVTGLKLGKMG